ncbi:PEP-CTERM sorting domain-containing protein [Duganella sp. PWIR1]
MKIRKTLPALAMALVFATSPLLAQAGVTYDIIDLVDNPGDPNRMKYVYHLDAATQAGYGYTLYFDADHYADIDAVTPAGSDWFATVAQPDSGAALPGLSSLLALNGIAAGLNQFEVSFTWLGASTPGPQAYEQFDDQFNVVANGYTILAAPVPEPNTTLLLIAGAILLACRSARHRRTS